MGLLKKEDSTNICSARLKIMADETRLAIVKILSQHPRNVSEINLVINVEQNALSHHLKILRENGFIVSSRKGKSVEYRSTSNIKFISGYLVVDLECCELRFDKARNKRAHA